jgi:hypothetical protein
MCGLEVVPSGVPAVRVSEHTRGVSLHEGSAFVGTGPQSELKKSSGALGAPDSLKFRQFTVTAIERVAASHSSHQPAHIVLRLQCAPSLPASLDTGARDGNNDSPTCNKDTPKRGDTEGRVGEQEDKASAVLHGSWVQSASSIAEGDTVVLVNCFEVEADGAWHLRGEGKSMVIVHPHVLISASALGAMISCPRRAVIQEMVKDSEICRSAVVGNMVHAVFQRIMSDDEWGEDTVVAAMKLGWFECICQSCMHALIELREGGGESGGMGVGSKHAQTAEGAHHPPPFLHPPPPSLALLSLAATRSRPHASNADVTMLCCSRRAEYRRAHRRGLIFNRRSNGGAATFHQKHH